MKIDFALQIFKLLLITSLSPLALFIAANIYAIVLAIDNYFSNSCQGLYYCISTLVSNVWAAPPWSLMLLMWGVPFVGACVVLCRASWKSSNA